MGRSTTCPYLHNGATRVYIRPMKKRVLFLCTSNRCRSQLAEALVNRDLGERFAAFSAGTAPKTPHPLALRALAEIGIDHSAARSKHLDEFAGESFDHVITLCDDANESCPLYFGKTRRAHLGFEDPDKATGTEEERLAVFRAVRDAIREKVETYLVRAERPERATRPTRPD
jgi:arsenate reductase (thioredoxin)